jgi:hypothetical protein
MAVLYHWCDIAVTRLTRRLDGPSGSRNGAARRQHWN